MTRYAITAVLAISLTFLATTAVSVLGADSQPTVHACVNASSGMFYNVSIRKPKPCRKNDQAVSFAQNTLPPVPQPSTNTALIAFFGGVFDPPNAPDDDPRLINMTTGQTLATYTGFGTLNSAVIVCGETQFLRPNDDATITQIDRSTGDILATYEPPENFAPDLDVSQFPALSCNPNRIMLVWTSTTGQMEARLVDPDSATVIASYSFENVDSFQARNPQSACGGSRFVINGQVIDSASGSVLFSIPPGIGISGC